MRCSQICATILLAMLIVTLFAAHAAQTIDLYKRKTSVEGFQEICQHFIVPGAPLQVRVCHDSVWPHDCRVECSIAALCLA
jgi:hypothetical protein